jgi:UTP--glucose-1-phosphate uridylyltransferase
MLPIVDKPLIQYAVEEAVEAGITEMIFITGRNKRAIEDHFDKAYELEAELEAAGKQQLLEMVRSVIPKNVNCMYIRQPMALGLGHAVLCAKPIVGDDAFAVLLADDFMQGERDGLGVMAQMTASFAREQSSLLGVQDVPRAHTKQYGIVSTEPFGERLEKIGSIVEKPAPELAPSTLAVVGRYVLTPRIFACLEKIGKGAGGEIQLTDGIEALMQYETVLAYRYQGRRFDCGSKLGYLQASVEIGLQHPETGAVFAEWLGQRS